LAQMRRKEFEAACNILNVSRGVVLDYADGQLHRLDSYRVVSELALQMRQFRPQVVLTFGPEGGFTGHTDHSMASVFGTLAFEWAGRENRYPDQLTNGVKPYRPQKLYYATANSALPGRPPITFPPATVSMDIAPYFEAKLAAFKSHTSQSPLFPLFEKHVRQGPPREMFHLVAAMNSAALEREDDLFAGVKED
ncbi:MAG TPA: PIG-L deacetylase family protein, partial [Terriglobales bacterium]